MNRDWCCMTRGETARALAEDVPAMTGAEIQALPRPVIPAALAVAAAAREGKAGLMLAAIAGRHI